MSLQGKTALVTGGARGIGFATVERLLKDGARCVIWDRDQAAIDEAKAKLDGLGEITSDTVELAKPDWSTQRLARRLAGTATSTSSSTTPASRASTKCSGNARRKSGAM